MQKTANDLRKVLSDSLPLLQTIDDKEASLKLPPEKWSRKEILGHLIDSACNNQQKFVRAMAQPHLDFVGYKQDFWVNSQKYNKAVWKNLVDLWHAYNLHLAHIIENTGEGLLDNKISIENTGVFTLEFIMRDYIEHLNHHLNQIFPERQLKSNFQNIYNT